MEYRHGGGLADAERWSWTLPFLLSSVPEARRRVVVALRSRSVSAHVIDDACSVVSELLGNALRHASPRSAGQVVVTLAVDDMRIVVAVEDGGAGTIPSIISPLPLARGGRGLGIVHSLTTDWGVKESADGNTVFGILRRA